MKTLLIFGKRCYASKFAQYIAEHVEKPEKHEGYIETKQFVITWAQNHLFQISDSVMKQMTFGQMWDEILWAEAGYGICPNWLFEFVDPSCEERFHAIKRLVHRNDVDLVIHAGEADPDGEIIIRTTLYMAQTDKPIMRMPLLTLTNRDFAQILKGKWQPLPASNRVAAEGYENMFMNYRRKNGHHQFGTSPVDQIPESGDQNIAKELRVLSSGKCCSVCSRKMSCMDAHFATNCAAFMPNSQFLDRLKVLIEMQGESKQ